MNVYRVNFLNNIADFAGVDNSLMHGEVGLDLQTGSVAWFAVECEDEDTALEIADKVVTKIWGSCR